MKRRYVYPAIFHPETEGGYSVFFPDLTGCQSQGDDLEDATLMAQEALSLFLEYHIDEDREVSAPSSPLNIKVENGDFVALVTADIFAQKEKTNSKAIKKTLTIPSWLNEEAEKQHLNFSSVLKEALITKIQE